MCPICLHGKEKGSFMYGTLAALDKVMTGIAVVVVQVLYKQIQR